MAVDIRKKIKTVVNQKGISVSEFGRRINKSRENVYSIFKRKSIDTDLLSTISKVLEHDFFQYYTSLTADVKKLTEDIKNLEEIIRMRNKKKE